MRGRRVLAAARAVAAAATVVLGLGLAPVEHAWGMGMGVPPKGHSIGSVDLDGYCQANHWDTAVLIGYSAGSWRCSKYVGVPISVGLNASVRGVGVVVQSGDIGVGYTSQGDIDLDAACRFTYQSNEVVGWIQSWWNPYTIVCVRA